MWRRDLESPSFKRAVDGIIFNALHYIVEFMINGYPVLNMPDENKLHKLVARGVEEWTVVRDRNVVFDCKKLLFDNIK